MQTFLPFADYAASAAVLKRDRLGKQRVENLQILTALLEDRGWVHHPATRMWAGYESSLLDYHAAIIHEWHEVRGHPDTTAASVARLAAAHDLRPTQGIATPWWLGDVAFHAAHRSALVRKHPADYAALGTRADLEYLWPDNSTCTFHLSKPGVARVARGELRDPRLVNPGSLT